MYDEQTLHFHLIGYMEQLLVKELALRGAAVLSRLPDGYTWGYPPPNYRGLIPPFYCLKWGKLWFYNYHVMGNTIGPREFKYFASDLLGYVDLNGREVWPYTKLVRNGDVKTLSIKIFTGRRLANQQKFLTLERTHCPDEPEPCRDR